MQSIERLYEQIYDAIVAICRDCIEKSDKKKLEKLSMYFCEFRVCRRLIRENSEFHREKALPRIVAEFEKEFGVKIMEEE